MGIPKFTRIRCWAVPSTLLSSLALLFYLSGICEAQNEPGIRFEVGVMAGKRLPKPVVSGELVLLDVPHIRQTPGNCVPTSSAMILRYFREAISPGELKMLAENHKPVTDRNAQFTYWKDMQHALKSKGKPWRIANYPKTDDGYTKGMSEIKASLRKGLPVMVDVHIGNGHTFVVIGFDESNQIVFIRDPATARNQYRVWTYEQMRAYWHNHRFSKSRSAFFAKKTTAQ